MSSNGKKENILTSWKEIAAYLDRDVRTCVRWEQRYGLPIHRLERDSKAKVFAYKDQIDDWLAQRSAVEPARPERKGILRFLSRPVLLVFALGIIAVAAYFLFLRPTGPSDFHIRGSELIVVDGRGRELGHFDTKLADLEAEDCYRTHLQEKKPSAVYVPVWPYIMIRDIDGDSRREVLFSTQTTSETRMDTLFCLDDRGNERWHFKTGRELAFGGQSFRREYRVFGFNVDDYDGDGTLEILVLSFHKPDWPCQAVLLDPAGNTEGEYWNAGYIMDGSAGDIDGDGQKELVLSGVNNEYRQGCLAVFKPGQLRGSSPQKDEAYRFAGFGEGGQSTYILFPKSDVFRAMSRFADPVNYFWIHGDGDGITAVTTETQIFYDLDRSLVCRGITLSNTFKGLREKLSLEGRLAFEPDEFYRKILAADLLYYRRGNWLPAPPAVVSANAHKGR
ncbi:MAG: FG-GAP repeat domain-containing protein [Candidatus Aminicenantales bacterium]